MWGQLCLNLSGLQQQLELSLATQEDMVSSLLPVARCRLSSGALDIVLLTGSSQGLDTSGLVHTVAEYKRCCC